MENDLPWTSFAAAIVLFFMMAAVGLGLSVDDFRRVARNPRVVVLGTLAQWTLLPAVASLLLLWLDLPLYVGAGLVLLTATPGGGVSNVMTYLAGANTALSVTLTATTSVLAAVTLPLLTWAGFTFLLGMEEGASQIPVAAMVGQLLLLVLLPLGLGMRLRFRRPDLSERTAAPLRRAVLVALVVLIAVGIGSDRSGRVGDLVRALPAAALWTLGAGAAGWLTGAMLRLDRADRFTFAIEFSAKNVGMAAIVALAGFQRPELAVFAGAYVAVGYPLALVASLVFRRLHRVGDAARA